MNNDPTFYTTPEEPTLLDPNALSPAETRRVFSRIGLSLLVLTLAMMLAGNGLDLLLINVLPGYYESWWRNWLISLVPLYAVALPLMILSLRGVKAAPHNTEYSASGEMREKPRFTVGHWLILLVIGFGCMYIGSLVSSLLMSIMSLVTGYNYQNGLHTMIEGSPTWITIIATCVCAPFGEEFIFRKLLIDRTRRFGDIASILLSGICFGLFHGNFFQFFYAALLGMILAYIYTRTGKYLFCVAMHAVINFIGSVVMPAISGHIPTDPEAGMTPVQALISVGLSLWIYGMIIAAIALFCVFWSRRRLSRGLTPLEGREMRRAVIANPGMMAALILLAILMVTSLIPPTFIADLLG